MTGIGFNSNTTVSIDGNNCPVVFFSYSLLTCQIPPNVNFTNIFFFQTYLIPIILKPTQTNKTVDVEVQQGSTNVTVPEQFTYDYSSTVIISSISPSVLSVLGKKSLNKNLYFIIFIVEILTINRKPKCNYYWDKSSNKSDKC